MRMIARHMAVVSRLALWLSALGLVLMTAFIAWQVFGRFVLNDTPTWTESMSVQLMGWFIFLGAAVGIREGYHLSFDVLLYVLSDRVKLWLFSISDLVVIAFSAGMAVYGYQLAEKAWPATLPNTGLPGGVDYLPLIGGGILMLVFTLERLVRRAAGLPTSRFGDDPVEDH